MARGDSAKAGMLAHIAGSAHSIIIKYPPRRTPATGTAPALMPMTPLTGPVVPSTVIPGAPATPEKPDATLKCLWYDSPTEAALASSYNRRTYGAVGWRQGAVAMACVAITGAALDPTKPYGKTVFDECEAVEHAGLRYRVLGLTRSSAAFTNAYLFYVWLSTSEVI